MKIVAARSADAAILTAISHAAKRHWGYPESWIVQWREILTVTAEHIASHSTFAAITEERIVGFYSLSIADDAHFEHLWVVPEAMGRGVGRALFTHAERIARLAGAKRLKIASDPHAEGFYRRMGAVACGKEPAFMDGIERYLPLLDKVL